eukprot:COSAG02_NODE_16253_length_1099_cov_1.105000_1_plen_62_part_00
MRATPRGMSVEGAAGAPSIDRRAQDTTYHLYSATDGFVPTVSQQPICFHVNVFVRVFLCTA